MICWIPILCLSLHQVATQKYEAWSPTAGEEVSETNTTQAQRTHWGKGHGEGWTEYRECCFKLGYSQCHNHINCHSFNSENQYAFHILRPATAIHSVMEYLHSGRCGTNEFALLNPLQNLMRRVQLFFNYKWRSRALRLLATCPSSHG